MSIRTVSLRVVSLMAMVPESECRTPTLMVACAEATLDPATPAASSAAVRKVCFSFMVNSSMNGIETRGGVRRGCRSHLQLDPDANLLKIGLHGVEARVLVENHHARVELLDEVVEIHLRRLLVVILVDEIQALAE